MLHELSFLFFSVKDDDHAPAYNDYFAERYAKEMQTELSGREADFAKAAGIWL